MEENNRFLDIPNTLELKKLKRLASNYDPIFYFSASCTVAILLFSLKLSNDPYWYHLLLFAGTLT